MSRRTASQASRQTYNSKNLWQRLLCCQLSFLYVFQPPLKKQKLAFWFPVDKRRGFFSFSFQAEKLWTAQILRFHRTSRQPYWNGGHVCVSNQPVRVQLFSCVNAFSCSNTLACALVTWVNTLYPLRHKPRTLSVRWKNLGWCLEISTYVRKCRLMRFNALNE